MRYMLLIYRDEKVYEQLSVQERGKIFQEAFDYSEARRPSGFYQGGEPLEPTGTATTVRMKSGEALMTDGPFAETKEQLAGYSIVEARDLDEALAGGRYPGGPGELAGLHGAAQGDRPAAQARVARGEAGRDRLVHRAVDPPVGSAVG